MVVAMLVHLPHLSSLFSMVFSWASIVEGETYLGMGEVKLNPDKAPAPLDFNGFTCNLWEGFFRDPNLALGGLKYSLYLFWSTGETPEEVLVC